MQKALLSRRALTAVANAVSKEETRYYLRGVCIEADARGVTYVATDGSILLAARDALGKDAEDNSLLGEWIIPTEICVDKRVKYRKNGNDTVELTRTADGLMLLGGEIVVRPIEGRFPDWRRILPRDVASGKAAQFDPDLLIRANNAGRVFGYGAVNMHVAHNGSDPALVTWTAEFDIFGVVMPLRCRSQARELPAWTAVEKSIPVSRDGRARTE